MGPIDELKSVIDEIVCPLIGQSPGHVCIIDPPNYSNVGDSAILLGELAFLGRHYPEARISFYDHASYSDGADRYIDEASILLLQGGGNFGDLWLLHQRMRNRILERFRHKRIIQMPQSIHFSSIDELKIASALIGQHPDFTLLARDRRSFEYASKNFDCTIRLCPDMAFAMNPVRRQPASRDYYCLLRTDKEAIADHEAVLSTLRKAGADFEAGDWLDGDAGVTRKLDRFGSRLTRRRPRVTAPARGLMTAVRRRYAERRLAYGIDLLSRGRRVITDRLHAHILSCVLGIPNTVLDSFDGKVSAFYETWTEDRTPSELLASPAELARRITGESGAAQSGERHVP